MHNENSSETAHDDREKSRLRLVDRSEEQKKASRPSEAAATELRGLIGDVQRNTLRKKQMGDSLPPAA